MDPTILLRSSLAITILAKAAADYFVVNDFEVEEHYMSFQTLVSLNKDYPNGRLFLSALPISDETIRSRDPTYITLKEIAILVSFQKGKVKADELAAMDQLVTLTGQIRDVCKAAPSPYAFTRFDSMKDDNGVPYSYQQMTRAGVFGSHFVAYYNLAS
jgi:hypothetical protein